MPCLAIELGIEPNYESRLTESARKHHWDVQVVKRVPFSDQWLNQNNHPLDPSFLKRHDVWFHGDITSTKTAQDTAWYVSADWNSLSYWNLLYHCESVCFNNKVQWTTLKKFLESPSQFITGNHFVRPSSVDKIFSGQIVSKSTYEKDIALLTAYDPPLNTIICIAPAKPIKQEARFVVIDEQIVCGSVYSIDRQHIEVTPTDGQYLIAQSLLEQMLEKSFMPSEPWTLDICQTSANTWEVLEVGALSCSGLYHCNTDKIIKALGRYYFGLGN